MCLTFFHEQANQWLAAEVLHTKIKFLLIKWQDNCFVSLRRSLVWHLRQNVLLTSELQDLNSVLRVAAFNILRQPCVLIKHPTAEISNSPSVAILLILIVSDRIYSLILKTLFLFSLNIVDFYVQVSWIQVSKWFILVSFVVLVVVVCVACNNRSKIEPTRTNQSKISPTTKLQRVDVTKKMK